LARDGAVSVAKREIRFIIESSVKVCYVQQESYNSSIERKLMQFDNELSSSTISIKEDLALRMLPEELRDDFSQEVGRLYGRTSGYVHLTPNKFKSALPQPMLGRRRKQKMSWISTQPTEKTPVFRPFVGTKLEPLQLDSFVVHTWRSEDYFRIANATPE
jgi:hypothetical protein